MATPRPPTNPSPAQAPTASRPESTAATTTTTTTTAVTRPNPPSAVPSAASTTTATAVTRPNPPSAVPSAASATTPTAATRPTPPNAATTTSTTRPTAPTATSPAPATVASNTPTLPATTPPATGTSESPKPTNAAQADDHKVSLVSTKSQFDIKIAEAGNKLVIVEFFAQWCGPCKIIGNKLEELAGKYENKAVVLKLDVDDCEDIAMEYNVTSMPTFVFLRNKKKINELIGSSDEKLFESVDKLCNDVNTTPDTITSTTNDELRTKKTSSISAKPAVK